MKFKGSKTPMELGGMRYIEEEHKILTHLIKEIGIPQLPFKMKGDVLQAASLKAFLRNTRYSKN